VELFPLATPFEMAHAHDQTRGKKNNQNGRDNDKSYHYDSLPF
jgi:hypothetical protein